MEKRVALFEVKALDDTDMNGEFEAILSVPTIDRDGEVIDGRAFEPLPDSIPIHAFHDFSSPVATATPFYEGDILKARGVFDPDQAAQTIRAKVGRSIRFMSVGFMGATRTDTDGVPHISKGELLEASFVSVPSNREAAILAVKDFTAKVGARNSGSDAERLQTIHDLAVANGAACETKAVEAAEEKSVVTEPEQAAAPAPATAPHDVTVDRARLAALAAEAELLLITS